MYTSIALSSTNCEICEERSQRFIRVAAYNLLPVVNALIRLLLLHKIIKPSQM